MDPTITIGDVAKVIDCDHMWTTIRGAYNRQRVKTAVKKGLIKTNTNGCVDIEDSRALSLNKEEFFSLTLKHLERINLDDYPIWRTGKKRALLKSIFDEHGLTWTGYESKDPNNPWFDRVRIMGEGGHQYTYKKEDAKRLGYL